jgi:hypothetical protein
MDINKIDLSKMDLTQRLLCGLDVAYKRMIEYKRKNNYDLVIERDGKVVHIKP